MSFIEASLTIQGDAFQVLKDIRAMSGSRAGKSVRLAVRVRGYGSAGRAGIDDVYHLPEIRDGDAYLALQHIDKLSRQTRLTDEETERVIAAVSQFVEITR